MPDWPDWWEWELDLTNPHLLEQMLVRKFNETDLREMLERATQVFPDFEPGRWAAATKFEGAAWEVILEPNELLLRVEVITAYDVW